MKLNDAEKNAVAALSQVLNLNKVQVTHLSLKKALWQHPDFPGLIALSDVLTDFKVPNLATRISPEQLTTIPLPAVAYLTVNGGIFAPVRSVGQMVEWFDTNRGWQKEAWNDFVTKWDGVMLLVAPDQQSGEADYAVQKRKQLIENLRVPFVIGSLVLLVGALFYGLLQKVDFATSGLYYSLLLTKTIGTIISGLLVWHGIDSQNSFLQSVCKLNDTTNCNNILSSPAAKLFDWLSWSEVGLFYFGGGLIYLLSSPLTPDGGTQETFLSPLRGLGALALPYTFWSVWYQWRVARQWCVLCLGIQVLLWVEFLISSPQTPEGGFNTVFKAPFGGLGAFLILPVLWALLKPYFQRAMPYEPLLREFQKLKFDPIYLEGLLNKQRNLPPIFDGMEVIEMGNPEAEHTLILVSNPTCAACRRNHLALEKLLQTTNNLKCQVILAANPQDEAGKVALQILSLPPHLMATALHSWFEREGQQWKQWRKQNDGNPEDPAAVQQLRMHLYWVQMAGINAAPKVFLNAVELPPFYNMAELPKLMAVFSNEGFAQIK
ncbi:MAG: peptidase C39 bacteriocin processing [Runella slithyformis]|nr:MAG: peptidase C39 bacteriocin processing [Runella slithyformis]TAF24905.1 MAG: peptidase C39 bacteriocin processing [Runella slithyformis]TAF48868.1 MAG: peptidase C39 bacteriocin processing [Runella slithyformis]TAF79763.1 MAG: peptidase C39 bacteriocin processing [Runella slithyformis]